MKENSSEEDDLNSVREDNMYIDTEDDKRGS